MDPTLTRPGLATFLATFEWRRLLPTVVPLLVFFVVLEIVDRAWWRRTGGPDDDGD